MVALARLLTTLVAALTLHSAATKAGNHAAARRDAERLLQRLVLPGGASRLARPPGGAGGLLSQPFEVPSGKLVDLHRFWRVAEPLDSVIAFVEAHRPAGAQRDGSASGFAGGPGYPRNETLTFAFPERPGRISLRWLNVTMVALPDGSTGVRADAQDVWIVTRPRNEVLPAGVREVDVDSDHVTDRTEVRKIVHWFDALPVVQPGVVHCPALVAGPTIRLVFRARDDVLARATYGADTINHSLLSTQCTPIRFSIDGHAGKPLVGGRFLLRVERLLGIRLR